MAELIFMHGPMGCGKSLQALSTAHNLSLTARNGRLFTAGDRHGDVVSSRVGISHPAVPVSSSFDFRSVVGEHLDHVVVDEAQFLSPAQVDQLAVVVDDHGIDVFAFGLATDFRGRFFPGAQRLMELADSQVELQLKAWCWCGQPGKVNARVIDGVVAYEGELVLIGDVESAPVFYTVLCRRHWREGRIAS